MISQTLLLENDLSLRIGEREFPEPTAEQVLVRVEWAGVCDSDLQALRTGANVTSWPAILGHEVVGVVVSSPGGQVVEGSRVVIDSQVPCGACEPPPDHRDKLPWFGRACPGGFESYMVVSAGGVVVCPEELEAAVGVLAEPCAMAMHAVDRATAITRWPGGADHIEHTVVLGYGPIAALIHLELSRRWPQMGVSVVESDPGRLELAEAYGASTLRSLGTLARRRTQLVVDAAGYAGSLAEAVGACSRGGTVLVVALDHHSAMTPSDLVEQELAIVGSTGFSDGLREAVSVLSSDPDRYRPLVTEAILLTEAPARMRRLLEVPSAGKVLIGPSWS